MQETLRKAQAELTALKNAPAAVSAAITVATGPPAVSTGSPAVSTGPPAVSTGPPAVSLPAAVSATTVSVTPTVSAATDVSTEQHIVKLLEQLVRRAQTTVHSSGAQPLKLIAIFNSCDADDEHRPSATPCHSGNVPRSPSMSSPASTVNDAVMTFLLKNAEENSLRKDIEVDRLQTELEKMKRERADKIQQENISNLRSSLSNAFGKSRGRK